MWAAPVGAPQKPVVGAGHNQAAKAATLEGLTYESIYAYALWTPRTLPPPSLRLCATAPGPAYLASRSWLVSSPLPILPCLQPVGPERVLAPDLTRHGLCCGQVLLRIGFSPGHSGWQEPRSHRRGAPAAPWTAGGRRSACLGHGLLSETSLLGACGQKATLSPMSKVHQRGLPQSRRLPAGPREEHARPPAGVSRDPLPLVGGGALIWTCACW